MQRKTALVIALLSLATTGLTGCTWTAGNIGPNTHPESNRAAPNTSNMSLDQEMSVLSTPEKDRDSRGDWLVKRGFERMFYNKFLAPSADVLTKKLAAELRARQPCGPGAAQIDLEWISIGEPGSFGDVWGPDYYPRGESNFHFGPMKVEIENGLCVLSKEFTGFVARTDSTSSIGLHLDIERLYFRMSPEYAATAVQGGDQK
jgi:hypothetical protein